MNNIDSDINNINIDEYTFKAEELDTYMRSVDAVFLKSFIHIMSDSPNIMPDYILNNNNINNHSIDNINNLDNININKSIYIINILCELGLGYVCMPHNMGLVGLMDINRAMLQIKEKPLKKQQNKKSLEEKKKKKP
eukprot:GHVL01021095.1.p1 GENE.GHVL01021095.1~~GHVL01021095.1.p1  ORF type:complete len:156 (-),score=63.85 GHVL01021095.1:31-441(-)